MGRDIQCQLQRPIPGIVLAVCAVMLASVPARPQTAPESSGPRDASAFARLRFHTNQLRHHLEGRGYTLQGQFVQDWSKMAWHAVDPAEGFGRYSLDLSVAVDGEKAVGWKGSAGFVRLKQHQKELGEDYGPAAQVYSNIDAPSRTWLYELWLQQTLLHGKVRLKGGKIDANTEFASVQTAGDFLNSSMGFSPTIVAFPTYPEPRPAFAAFLRVKGNNELGSGIFQTAGWGRLTIVEPRHNWSLASSERPGRVSLGYWRLDGGNHTLSGRDLSSTQGFYSVLEQSIFRKPLGQSGAERNLTGFFQFGDADEQVTIMTRHAGGGLVLQGPFSARNRDAVGVAATWVRFTRQPVAGFDYQGELVVEGYYKLSITRAISLVQDVQLLRHPSGVRTNPDCAVVTPRLVIVF